MTRNPSPAATIAQLVRAHDGLPLTREARLPIASQGGGVNGRYPHAPIVVLALVGLSPGAAAIAVRETTALQLVSDGIRVLVWADEDPFGLVRPLGWPVEHVMSEGDWCRLDQPSAWDAYCLESLEATVREFGVAAVLTTDEDGHLSTVPPWLGLSGDRLRRVAGTARLEPSAGADPRNWRSWAVQDLPLDRSTATVDGRHPTVVRHHHRGSAALLVVVGALATGPALLTEASERRWSTVEIEDLEPADSAHALRFARGALTRADVRVLATGDGYPASAASGFDFRIEENGEGGPLQVSPVLETRSGPPPVAMPLEQAFGAFDAFRRSSADERMRSPW